MFQEVKTKGCSNNVLCFEEMNQETHIVDTLPGTEERRTLDIGDLPTEVLEFILKFLGAQDHASCFNVCTEWRHILNKNALWQKYCIYDKKYYIHCKLPLGTEHVGDSEEICAWKRCYDKEQAMFDNLVRGQFVKEEVTTRIKGCLRDLIDDKGYHWLFQYNTNVIHIWDITESAKLHFSYHSDDSFTALCVSKDKIILHRSDYIKVLKFEYPKYELSPAYRFIFDKDNILSDTIVVPEDYYTSFSRHLVVDKYFVGYYETISDIKSCKFHIWDITLAEKVATQEIYQQSFVDFARSSSNVDITESFRGGLLLFGANDSSEIVVAVIHDDHELCQVSLFSLENRQFENVIAQLKSKRVWCFMRNGVVVIHSIDEDHSQLSIYEKSGNLLTRISLLFSHNPAFNHRFWFSGSKMILCCTNRMISIVDIVNKQNVKIRDFKINEDYKILGFYEPRFLLLYRKYLAVSDDTYVVSVWDIMSGTFLFNLTNCSPWIGTLHSWVVESAFPGKLIVPEILNSFSVLDFCTQNVK